MAMGPAFVPVVGSRPSAEATGWVVPEPPGVVPALGTIEEVVPPGAVVVMPL